MNTDKYDWYGQKIETKSDPLIDPGSGKPVILRQFFFKYDPKVQEQVKRGYVKTPTRQDLFNQVWPLLRPLIWSDGLVANTDISPKITVGKKGFVIILTCEPRFGQMVADRPKRLEEVLNKKSFTK